MVSIETSGGSAITIAKAGIYAVRWAGTIDVSESRPIPGLDIYENDDTVGTDTPLGRITSEYHRTTNNDQFLGHTRHGDYPCRQHRYQSCSHCQNAEFIL